MYQCICMCIDGYIDRTKGTRDARWRMRWKWIVYFGVTTTTTDCSRFQKKYIYFYIYIHLLYTKVFISHFYCDNNVYATSCCRCNVRSIHYIYMHRWTGRDGPTDRFTTDVVDRFLARARARENKNNNLLDTCILYVGVVVCVFVSVCYTLFAFLTEADLDWSTRRPVQVLM